MRLMRFTKLQFELPFALLRLKRLSRLEGKLVSKSFDARRCTRSHRKEERICW